METIATFNNTMEAYFAKNLLEENNIRVLLADVNLSGLYSGAVVAIRLQVMANDVESAKEILQANSII